MENRVLGMMLRSASAVRQFAQLHQWAQAPSSQQRKTRAAGFDGKVVITKDSGVRKRIRALARNGVDPDLLRTMRQRRMP